MRRTISAPVHKGESVTPASKTEPGASQMEPASKTEDVLPFHEWDEQIANGDYDDDTPLNWRSEKKEKLDLEETADIIKMVIENPKKT